MATEILQQLDNYAYNPFAMPHLFAASAVLVVGISALIRERESRALLAFTITALCIFCWMLGSALSYLAQDVGTAAYWVKVAIAGTIFVPAAVHFFAAAVVNKHEVIKWRLGFLFGISFALLTALLSTPLYVEAVTLRPWGYYPSYGPIGVVFMLYLLVVHTSTLGLLWGAHRKDRPGSASRRRTTLVLTAVFIGTFASVDFLPTKGIEIYPFGFIFVLAFLGIVSFVSRSSQLIDITPALASETIVNTIHEALVVVSLDGAIRLVNPAAEKLLGRSQAELLESRFSDSFAGMGSTEIHESLISGSTIRGIETAYKMPIGTVRTVSVSASVLRGRKQNPIAFIYVLQDITKRKHAEDRIRFLAYHDTLTKLPNRAQFDEKVQHALSAVAGSENSVSILYIDLDRFKGINDTLGHDAGDRVLMAAANRLRKCFRMDSAEFSLREPDTLIARLGGDEFAVALTGVCRIQDIRNIAQRVIDRLSEPFMLHEEKVYIGASIGISMSPRDGTNAGTLLKNADQAMYHAKEAGRGNFHFYNSAMNNVTADRVQIDRELHRALERSEFELTYQPQIDVRTNTIFGCEALLRWRNPKRGLIAPADFIPLVEDSGAICNIGRWVLQEACKQAKEWEQSNLGIQKVSVNISARQFRHSDLVEDVWDALQQADLDPRSLELELTESLIMRDADQTITHLTQLKNMGLSIAVDDFGTGYSSLSYLRRFPIDVIKIDRTFIHDISAGLEDAAVTSAIIALAHNLHRDVVAEGVETRKQVELLREKGCHKMQGHLFGRPCSAEQFTRLVKAKDTSFARTGQKIVDFRLKKEALTAED